MAWQSQKAGVHYFSLADSEVGEVKKIGSGAWQATLIVGKDRIALEIGDYLEEAQFMVEAEIDALISAYGWWPTIKEK